MNLSQNGASVGKLPKPTFAKIFKSYSGVVKKTISKVAIQKLGSEYKMNNNREEYLSNLEFCLLAAFTPIGMAIEKANRMAKKFIIIVHLSASKIFVETCLSSS